MQLVPMPWYYICTLEIEVILQGSWKKLADAENSETSKTKQPYKDFSELGIVTREDGKGISPVGGGVGRGRRRGCERQQKGAVDRE